VRSRHIVIINRYIFQILLLSLHSRLITGKSDIVTISSETCQLSQAKLQRADGVVRPLQSTLREALFTIINGSIDTLV